MNPLLKQFLSEAHDSLQGIGEKLMQLEKAPTDTGLINDLFRLVHTLKGNSGLFEFPEMTRVLHAGEDLMDAIRNGRVVYSRELADRLLDAMDFVAMLCDELEANQKLGVSHADASVHLARSLRQLNSTSTEDQIPMDAQASEMVPLALPVDAEDGLTRTIELIPEAARMDAYRRVREEGVFLVLYTPIEGCFYQGDDPFYQASQTPGLLWGGIRAREPWLKLEELDAYRSILDFHILTTGSREELADHYRYVLDQVRLVQLSALALVLPQGNPQGGPGVEIFVDEVLEYLKKGHLSALETAAQALLEILNPDLWLSSALRWLLVVLEKEPQNGAALQAVIESIKSLHSPNWSELSIVPASEHPTESEIQTAPEPSPPDSEMLDSNFMEMAHGIIAIQRAILAISDDAPWQRGRIQAAANTLAACLKALGDLAALEGLDSALKAALAANKGAALLSWLDGRTEPAAAPALVGSPPTTSPNPDVRPAPMDAAPDLAAAPRAEGEVKFGRRAEDTVGGAKSLKVDQIKIDRLMNLIGEMVVSKNALPYLAGRAETTYGVRELSREIKANYAVINRIAEEMQDAIMQVCMMPVSYVFQRFPRLIRDTSRKLGKEVNLVLVGEETEADKNIIESLGDPLIHIIRNSLDHGFELPEVRLAAGKPVAGTLTIRASQESDRVLIEIQDDGKGIDPLAIKRKAYETGVIDEATLDRISDQEAVNLIFAPGLSTVEVISDLSGRGVGMDVVRTAVEKVNGTIQLESEQGKGTRICLSLPLSMAVTNVMIIESDGQIFGVPMECVIETVRVSRSRIRNIKKSQTTVLRGRIVALKSLNALLGITAAPKANADDELAVLVVRLGEEPVGLLVDNFHQTVDVILKPMTGVLAGLPAYAGSALMGDGSVLMVLNIKEVL